MHACILGCAWRACVLTILSCLHRRYVLEVTTSRGASTWNVQLRKPEPSEGPLKTQRWRYADERLWCAGPVAGEDLVLTCECPPGRDSRIGDSFVVAPLQTTVVGSRRAHLTVHTIPPGSGRLNVTVLADGPTRVLRIQDSAHTAPPVPLLPTVAGLLSPQRQVPDAQPPTLAWDIQLELDMTEGVGVSVVDTEELAYVNVPCMYPSCAIACTCFVFTC